MTDQELSRAIAEKLEPKPKEWQLDARYMKHVAWCLSSNISPEWVPRDMVHDPAMTVMLIKRLISRGANIVGTGAIAVGAPWPNVAVEYGATTEDCVLLPVEQLGRAVAEAYAKAEGILA